MGRDAAFDFGYNLPHAAPQAAHSSGSIADELKECMGNLSCGVCGRFHGYCSEVRQQLTGVIEGQPLKENNDMDVGNLHGT